MAIEAFEEEEFETQFNGQTVMRILKQALPHWPMLAGFLILIALVSLVDALFTYLSKLIIDDAILVQDTQALAEYMTLYGGLIVVQAVGVFGFIYLVGVLGEQIRYDLRKRMFAHLQELSFSYFDRTPVGWIMSRVTSDAERIAELVTWGLLDVSWGVLSITISFVFMFAINWKMALIVLVTIPILIVVAFEFKRHILNEFRRVRRINSKITGAYNENITGVKVTKSLATGSARFEGVPVAFHQICIGLPTVPPGFLLLFLPVVQLITAVGVAAVVWFGGLQVQIGEMTVGDIQAFIAYITFMMWPIQEMARVYAQMQQSIASGERVFSLIDAVPDVQDKPEALETAQIRGDNPLRSGGVLLRRRETGLAGFQPEGKAWEKRLP